MISLIGSVVLAAVLSFFLTPGVAELARRWHILDQPGARKIHVAATPRAGGIAIYLAFMIAFLTMLLHASVRHLIVTDERMVAFMLGGAVVFGLGLWDDVRPLRPTWKLAGQIAAALIAYVGGLQIVRVALPGMGDVTLGALSLPATVLWFVLVVNALNLIDGLDGLATGITLFAALILLIVMESSGRFLVAIGLACLAGAALGFLRYNFYPASIFLGDSGSYFFGYSLAALSIMGSLKSEATVTILIPIIALGVPVMDTLWSPIRRFLLGQRVFHPDRDHIHHRLLKLGYTHRRAVLILYGITIAMGLLSLSLVHTRDGRTAWILLLVGAVAMIGIRKLGYFQYIDTPRVVGWLGTVSDELGLRRDRRSFLECQVSIAQANTLDEMWEAVTSAAQFLEIDHCELTVAESSNGEGGGAFRHAPKRRDGRSGGDDLRTLRISMPLLDHDEQIGSLVVAQEIGTGSTNPYLLRRVDQLRGTIAETLLRLRDSRRTATADAAAGVAGNGRGQRKRILFLSHYFPPEGNAPARRVHAMCRRWVDSGHAVTVITCTPNVPDGIVYPGYKNKLYQQELIDGINTIRVWTYLAANKGTALRIFNYLSYMASAVITALFTEKPDVVIATSPQFFCGWAGVIVSRLRRVPLILEIRDIWPDGIATVGAMTNGRMLRALEWLELRMYAAADHIVTVGEGYRDELVKKGGRAEQITVISNGVDRDAFFPREPDHQVRDRWKLGDSFVCAYVGTIGMASGLDIVLRAARLLQEQDRPDIKFLMVGDGAVRNDLQREVERSGLENIVFTGRQSKDAIPSILASVDACLVHLKKRELFTTVMPSKIFEAAAMTKPIILGVQGHAAELVRRASGGICIEPESETELVDAVLRMAGDRKLVADLGRNGHDFFVAHFDRSRLAKSYLDLIHRVISTAGTGGTHTGDAPRRTAGRRSPRREITPVAKTIRPPRAEGDAPPGMEASR